MASVGGVEMGDLFGTIMSAAAVYSNQIPDEALWTIGQEVQHLEDLIFFVSTFSWAVVGEEQLRLLR